jgi:hypothetical protein
MIAEIEVARVAGVGREKLREIRKGMREGVDFAREASGAVVLSHSGIEAVEAALGVRLDALRAVEKWDPGVRTLRVARIGKNRRVVLAGFVGPCPWKGSANEAERVDEQGFVRLTVHDAGKLFAGAILDGRWVEADVWEMIGRGPRSRMEAGLVEQRREMAQESV